MKKIKLFFIMIIAFIILMLFGSNIYAANTMDLNIIDSRPYTSKKYTVTTPNANVHTIFKIVKKNGAAYTREFDSCFSLKFI